jgi:hypothetical protein
MGGEAQVSSNTRNPQNRRAQADVRSDKEAAVDSGEEKVGSTEESGEGVICLLR